MNMQKIKIGWPSIFLNIHKLCTYTGASQAVRDKVSLCLAPGLVVTCRGCVLFVRGGRSNALESLSVPSSEGPSSFVIEKPSQMSRHFTHALCMTQAATIVVAIRFGRKASMYLRRRNRPLGIPKARTIANHAVARFVLYFLCCSISWPLFL